MRALQLITIAIIHGLDRVNSLLVQAHQHLMLPWKGHMDAKEHDISIICAYLNKITLKSRVIPHFYVILHLSGLRIYPVLTSNKGAECTDCRCSGRRENKGENL